MTRSLLREEVSIPPRCARGAIRSQADQRTPERGLCDDLALAEGFEHPAGRLFGRAVGRVDDHLGVLRRLVRRIDAGEVLDLALLRASVETLRIAPHALLERSVDEHLDEFVAAHQLAHHAPL